MARIFFSMAGEGRGHAARARTLVESLRDEHEIALFAPDDAYHFLAPMYGPERNVANVTLTRIPGIRFHYTGGRLDLSKTIMTGLSYGFRELPRVVAAFRRKIQAERPDLIITDFEPALPRAGVRDQVPVISIDHQHVLMAYDLHSLPWDLRMHAWLMSWAVWLYYPRGMTARVASSFYTPPLKKAWRTVHQVGPLIRPEVASAQPTTGDYILSYLRANTPERVVDLLVSLDRPIKLYGLGERPSRGQVTFCAIHETRFVEDLAGSQAVICAAGNQLLGESLFLGKPVLAVPESIHHEQRINAHYLKEMGVGDWSTLEDLTRPTIDHFLERLDSFRHRLVEHRGQLNGTADVLHIIQGLLQPVGDSARLPLAVGL